MHVGNMHNFIEKYHAGEGKKEKAKNLQKRLDKRLNK